MLSALLPLAAADAEHRRLMLGILDTARYGEQWDRTIVLGIDAALRAGERVDYWTRVKRAMLERMGWSAVRDEVATALMTVYSEEDCRLIAEALKHEGARLFFARQAQVQAVTSDLATRLAERIMPELSRIE